MLVVPEDLQEPLDWWPCQADKDHPLHGQVQACGKDEPRQPSWQRRRVEAAQQLQDLDDDGERKEETVRRWCHSAWKD